MPDSFEDNTKKLQIFKGLQYKGLILSEPLMMLSRQVTTAAAIW